MSLILIFIDHLINNKHFNKAFFIFMEDIPLDRMSQKEEVIF